MGEGATEIMNHLGLALPFRLFPEAPSPAPVPEPPGLVVQAQPVIDPRESEQYLALVDLLAAQGATVVDLEKKVKDLEKQLSIMEEKKETLVSVCYAHQRGECTRGDDCRFSHSGEAQLGRPTGKQRQTLERQRRSEEISQQRATECAAREKQLRIYPSTHGWEQERQRRSEEISQQRATECTAREKQLPIMKEIDPRLEVIPRLWRHESPLPVEEAARAQRLASFPPGHPERATTDSDIALVAWYDLENLKEKAEVDILEHRRVVVACHADILKHEAYLRGGQCSEREKPSVYERMDKLMRQAFRATHPPYLWRWSCPGCGAFSFACSQECCQCKRTKPSEKELERALAKRTNDIGRRCQEEHLERLKEYERRRLADSR